MLSGCAAGRTNEEMLGCNVSGKFLLHSECFSNVACFRNGHIKNLEYYMLSKQRK